jgi:hypothetical protein
MSQRRVLVIGSQCKALGRLTFLPQVAQDLYAVMTDPDRGECVSAIEGDGLLINPTVKETKAAIRSAYFRAAKDQATLLHCLHRPWREVGEQRGLLSSASRCREPARLGHGGASGQSPQGNS